MTAGLPALPRLRSRATNVARRAARRLLTHNLARRLRRPEISVIVPFYNVEQYLAECLDSLLGQSYGDFEVLLVDDGSPDGSRAIADRYAAQDSRVRIVTRPNGGLGAARNTGVRHARGRFLTFVDSDDTLPSGALAALVDSAHRTGSDIVAGSMERFDSLKVWTPKWVPQIQTVPRERVVIEDFLPLLRNLYTCDKLFRRDFWDAQGLWFREGVAYEDQPIVTQLLARAKAIDVLPAIVYRYRARDDRSSISQQTASLKDLRDRIAAWMTSREVLRREVSDAVYEGWLATLFDAHFQWYLASPGTVEDDYWTELADAVRELAADAPDWVWQHTAPPQRLLVRLAQLDRRADAQEFVRAGGQHVDRWPATVREDGILLHLPLLGAPGLDEDLFVVRPERVTIAHSIEKVRWVTAADGRPTCHISGWAYLTKVDLTDHASTVSVVLRHEQTGEERVYASTSQPEAAFPQPVEDTYCAHTDGTFGVELPIAELMDEQPDGTSWAVWLRVDAAGFSATTAMSRLLRSGSAGVIPAARLPEGDRIVADWQFMRQLAFRVDRSGVRVADVRLRGRTLSGTLEGGAHTGDVRRVVLVAPGQTVDAVVEVRGPDQVFEVDVPAAVVPEPGRSSPWGLAARTADGTHVPLVPDPGTRLPAVEADESVTVVLDTDRNGELVVASWLLGAVADRVTVTEAGELRVTGRTYGLVDATVGLATRNKRTRTFGPQVPVVDGRFEATLELRHELYRFGSRPLPIGDHDLSCVVASGAEEIEIPLRVSAGLNASLPVPVATDLYQGRVVRGPDTVVRVVLQRPLGAARGRYQQHRLQGGAGRPAGLTRGVLMRSYFGEQATDNGLSIQKELQRRGSDLPVYWAVQDHSVPVPDGGIPIVVNTFAWYELLGSIAYYVDNMYQPEYHTKPAGQVMVQTFHGYPFKQMGHPHWRNQQISQARINTYDARAAEWDYLVSPARYATPLLTRDFNYHGEVLEIGYPRNDVLHSPEADEIRAATRASLGIEEGQTAVLFAPTFRDYLSEDGSHARMADLLDLAATARALGDGFVLMVRGHAFNARTAQRVGSIPGCVDVTDYPEISDLYLAADAGIVDYSSLRFDFGVTGKPMVFHVPDLQRYQDTRGWLFDFEPTAPGPLVATTEEVVDRLRDLDGLRAEYATAYKTFQDTYLDLEDGHAGQRFVDAVFVPRGDA